MVAHILSISQILNGKFHVLYLAQQPNGSHRQTKRADMLSEKYQSEQAELEEKIEQLQSSIDIESQSTTDAEIGIALTKACVNPTEFTAELLNTLIEAILVHEAVKNEDGAGNRK